MDEMENKQRKSDKCITRVPEEEKSKQQGERNRKP